MASPLSPDSKSADREAGDWPGRRLGLPESGPRSVARLGRRVAALVIDWGLAYLLAWVFFSTPGASPDPFTILAIFAILQIVFLALLGGSVGHLLLGMRLVPLVPGWIGVWRPAVRTVFLCIGIPALIWDRDQRGFHDRLAGTVLVRR
ncbi:RDD family protein [Lacisediminihabitans profunda]|uniref:RDD family protein n=1 Tax=Lacisediminihabitans profunda TaxID=2594790 RepID=A0A5C8UU41_9MICO|nr:RDD family protein [Lacisediminihabitans profunda]TXN32163.1 RDD family protein [Lacisediminihabitans profunda]